jgi:hypothetical protein
MAVERRERRLRGNLIRPESGVVLNTRHGGACAAKTVMTTRCPLSAGLPRSWPGSGWHPKALGSIRRQYHRPRSRGRAAGWVGSPAARPWPRNRACRSATSARWSSASTHSTRLSSPAPPAPPARAAGQGGPSGISISALIGQERRVPTLQGGESPMPDSGSPVVSHNGGRSVAEPSASNADQRPVSRRQALAYDSSLAAALPPPSGAPDGSAYRCSLRRSTTAA